MKGYALVSSRHTPPNGVRFLWEQGKNLFRVQAGWKCLKQFLKGMSRCLYRSDVLGVPSTTTIYAPLSLEACVGFSVCRVVVGTWPED